MQLRSEARKEKGSGAVSEKSLKLIAVLPLRNLGPAEDEYFAAGITEEIISRLTKIRGLGLISSSSTASYKEDSDARAKEIGEELGVDYVISGGIRWARNQDGSSRVRITPRLIRVEDNMHLWSEIYDRTMENIFEVQADIAASVAQQLGAALDDSTKDQLELRPTENQEAYQAYLRGPIRREVGDVRSDCLETVLSATGGRTRCDICLGLDGVSERSCCCFCPLPGPSGGASQRQPQSDSARQRACSRFLGSHAGSRAIPYPGRRGL